MYFCNYGIYVFVSDSEMPEQPIASVVYFDDEN